MKASLKLQHPPRERSPPRNIGFCGSNKRGFAMPTMQVSAEFGNSGLHHGKRNLGLLLALRAALSKPGFMTVVQRRVAG
jgi:hypothetical protein